MTEIHDLSGLPTPLDLASISLAQLARILRPLFERMPPERHPQHGLPGKRRPLTSMPRAEAATCVAYDVNLENAARIMHGAMRAVKIDPGSALGEAFVHACGLTVVTDPSQLKPH